MTDIRLERGRVRHRRVAFSDRKMAGSLALRDFLNGRISYYIDGNEVAQTKLEELAFGNHELVILARRESSSNGKGL